MIKTIVFSSILKLFSLPAVQSAKARSGRAGALLEQAELGDDGTPSPIPERPIQRQPRPDPDERPPEPRPDPDELQRPLDSSEDRAEESGSRHRREGARLELLARVVHHRKRKSELRFADNDSRGVGLGVLVEGDRSEEDVRDAAQR